MLIKLFPWKFVLQKLARSQGFVDPIRLLSKFNQFAQPSEIVAPLELIRAGVALHARGLINSQVIQHNLDWIWPYWVERQFDPLDSSFIPRAFSITHINLTHRNWTAVGLPGCAETPLIDPRGLLMPFYDSWSLDVWLITDSGESLIPSRMKETKQWVEINHAFSLNTECNENGMRVKTKVQAITVNDEHICRLTASCQSNSSGWMVIALRPYNPEGISFIDSIVLLPEKRGWKINKKALVYFDTNPDLILFSDYQHGDVYNTFRSKKRETKSSIHCNVGMATALAGYNLQSASKREVDIDIPLHITKESKKHFHCSSQESWEKILNSTSKLELPYRRFRELYQRAIETVIIHTPNIAYAGPFTYKRFWIRDTAFILQCLLDIGLTKRAQCLIEHLFCYQKHDGYYVSQEGEWDSNGQALWAQNLYCQKTLKMPPRSWKDSIVKAAQWIVNKRIKNNHPKPHSGLLPSGFSAEHLGPNDYYYWDNFWSVSGLLSASEMLTQLGDNSLADQYKKEAKDLLNAIEKSLQITLQNSKNKILPSSPYRRPDSSSVGSLVSSYPLQIWEAQDPRIASTTNFLFENHLINGGLYHDVSHSGINPYLTLHIAQAFLRASDIRYFKLVNAIADLASPTGQWPEAIHPQIGTGCMGDGQHVWAAAEWIVMIKNLFVREEIYDRKLILCSGLHPEMLPDGAMLQFGPTYTSYGPIEISVVVDKNNYHVGYDADWKKEPPYIEIAFPNRRKLTGSSNKSDYLIPTKDVSP